MITKALFVSLLSSSACFAAVGQTATFQSPNGVQEQCIAIEKLPGADYSKKDLEKEAQFCSINFYNNTTALCPKYWSTSAGTMVYLNPNGSSSAQTESTCRTTKNTHLKTVAKFKQTMNQNDTSGTFGMAPVVYYHLSRYFDTVLTVPVAVYRSMDKDSHYDRVTSRARPPGSSPMNTAAWKWFSVAEQSPASWNERALLFTPDNQQIYGALMKESGDRYGAEFNGTRKSGWGDGQNNDFQETPPYMALRQELPLAQAIPTGIAMAKQDGAIKRALNTGDPSALQMVIWMRELTELTLLDFIFSQQDRIGNIDFKWRVVYVKDGKAHSDDLDVDVPESSTPRDHLNTLIKNIPQELKAYNPQVIQKTSIGDNDAGGLVRYANYTKRTQMLQKIRHYSSDLYRRLISLNKDFAAKGPLYQAFQKNFNLPAGDLNQMVANTKLATDIIQGLCRSNKLRFDLDHKKFIKGEVTEEKVNCDNP